MKSNKDKSDEDKDEMKRVGREAKERMSSQMENRKKRKNIRCACFALLALGVVSVAFWGYRFAPYDPLETNFTQKLMPPSMAHPFGTDNVGRDVLSRVLCGAGNSFKLVFLMLAIVVVIGTAVGIISGYFGGILDTVLMRITDILLAFPDTIFAIAIVGMIGPGLLHTVVALAFVWWTKYARMARGMTAVIRNQDYVIQAQFGGVRTPGILLRYVLPNILPQVIVMTALDVGGMMLSLAGLSFLGLASQPPAPEWGYMLYEGKSYLQTAPWIMIFAGLAIFLTVMVFNLLGDSLRDVLDPKEWE